MIADKDLVRSFKCGNQYIDKFVRDLSFKSKDLVTYAAIDDKQNKLISVLSLACSGIYTMHSPKSPRKNSLISAFEIKYFATDVHYQKIPYSENEEDLSLSYQIFAKWMKDIIQISQNVVGAKKIILYSVPEAESFYRRFNFTDFKQFMAKDEQTSLNGCIPLYFNLNC